jgi:hypothetical protein
MKRLLPIAVGLVAMASITAAAFAGPSYDADGKIVIPANMDRWPTVGTTYALSYEGDGGTTLNTVRLDPESYDAYVQTGQFPVGAIMQLEVRRPVEEIAPASVGNPIPRSQACYSCHEEHAGKTDTVFMQFYPTLNEAHKRTHPAKG